MVLLLRESEINNLLDMKSAISCLEMAFRQQSEEGKVLQPERQVIQPKGSDAVIRLMAAVAPEIQAFGVKALLGVPPKRKPQSTYFVTLLFDPSDASLLAIIPAARLTQIRTGAASGIATKYLARRDSRTIGILGAGVQGFGQLEGVANAIRLTRGKIFDIDAARADAFAAKAREQFAMEFERATKIEELYESDVLCTATTTTTPLIFGERLRAGTHVNAIGSNAPSRQELHESVLLKSIVFVDRIEQALAEAGDFAIPIKKGLYDRGKIRGEICNVIAGKEEGRTSDTDITLFKSVGIALEDVAVARAVYELALEKGVGQKIDFQ